MLIKIGFTPKVQVSGVVGYVDMNGLDDGPNIAGFVVQDDPCFAKGPVHSHGQLIDVIYMRSLRLLHRRRPVD